MRLNIFISLWRKDFLNKARKPLKKETNKTVKIKIICSVKDAAYTYRRQGTS